MEQCKVPTAKNIYNKKFKQTCILKSPTVLDKASTIVQRIIDKKQPIVEVIVDL